MFKINYNKLHKLQISSIELPFYYFIKLRYLIIEWKIEKDHEILLLLKFRKFTAVLLDIRSI